MKRSPRWGVLLAWLVVISLLVLIAVQLRSAMEGSVGEGQNAPVFTLQTFDGQTIGLEEMADKVVVVNFWASWCTPCEVEAADLQDAWEHYQPRGDVLFLGVDYVDTETEALEYLERFAITYPNGPDLGTRVSQAFRITGVPETYFIDKDGVLAYTKIGPFGSLGEIMDIVDGMLE